MTDSKDLELRPSYESFTENTDFVVDSASEICDFLRKTKGLKNGKLRVNVLTVLSAGWDEVWENAFKSVERRYPVQSKIRSFDNNLNQIQAHGKDSQVVFMSLGTEEGNETLASFLEPDDDGEAIDVLHLSNIGDFVGNKGVESLIEVLDNCGQMPAIITFSGQEMENEFGATIEGLEDLGYKVRHSQTGDYAKREVRFQGIAFYDDSVDEEY